MLLSYAQAPDSAITRLIEKTDSEVLIKAVEGRRQTVIRKNHLHVNAYAMGLLLKHDKTYLEEVSAQLCRSEKFLLSVVDFSPEIVRRIPLDILNEELAFALIQKNYICLKELPPKFCKDYEMCRKIARENGFSLMYFDLSVRSRDEIVLEAVSNRGNALSMALPHQKKNRDIVSAAVKNSGIALCYADPALQGDFDIVMQAVRTHGIALRYAAPHLRDTEEIVKVAVANDGYAFLSASSRLQAHYEIARLAVLSQADVYRYLSLSLRNHPEIKKIYASKKEEEEKWLPSKMQ